MAPRLPLSKLGNIQNMISNKSLTAAQMVKAADCSKRLIINIKNNFRRFENVESSSLVTKTKHNTSDERSTISGCDERTDFRRTGWSPLGAAPFQIAIIPSRQS
ncbi:Probable transposable element [Penicillium roqueforti FM164]|uniref:Probable transposable element n=1 Tax=Penicillium roqueforti (strain FM164) TaxID=1365484 RepID=W6Q1D8_PENRF|nr:Probable transposable element [Penicillium roqueforti FM164]